MSIKLFAITITFALVLLAVTFTPLSSQQDRTYDPWADINLDGKVDVNDLAYLATKYGTEGTPHSLEKSASYIICVKGSTIMAINGSTGKIDYSGINASTVIQSVIDALGEGGGIVFVKKGQYNLTATIAFPKTDIAHFLVEGEGWETVFTTSNPSLNLFTIEGAGSGQWSTYPTGIILRNFKISGPGAGTGAGIYYRCADYQRVENLMITKMGYGIRGRSELDDSTIWSSHFELNRINGIILETACVGNRVVANFFASNWQDGLIIGWGCERNTVTANSFEENQFSGIFMIGGDLNTITANNFWTNVRHGVMISTSSDDNVISSNVFWKNSWGTSNFDGIRIETASRNLVSNNQLRDSLAYGIKIVSSTSYNNTLINNKISGTNLGAISDAGTGTKIKDNCGYVTENSGTANISASTYVDVSHGLADIPSFIIVTPQSNINGNYWVNNVTSSTFRINVDTSQTVTFYWKAEV